MGKSGFSSMVDILSSPACILDPDGHVVHLNSDWRARAGLGGSDGRSVPFERLIDARDGAAAVASLRQGTSVGERLDIECRLPEVSGCSRWHRLTLHPLDKGGEGPRGWLCIAADIHDLRESEARLRHHAEMQTDMLSGSVDCIKLIALDGTLLHMNKAGCLALGVAEDSGFGMAWLPLLQPEVRAAGEHALALARAGSFARFAGRSELPGQKPVHWDNMLTPVIGHDMKPSAILCVSREVTAEQEALQLLRESEKRLMIATRVGGLGIWDFDILQGRLQCDDGWYRIMGRDPATPIGTLDAFRPFIHPDDVERATEVTDTAGELGSTGRDYAIKFRIIRPNGEIRWLRSAASLIRNPAGELIRAIGFVVDITEALRSEQALLESNRELEAEKMSLARQSLEDPLTGIANRRHLDRELARICRDAKEHARAICVGMVDVDNFKAYNDRYGHLKGDAALREVASVLKSVVRKSDLVARYGGEEFAFVLMDTTNPGPLLDRLIASVAERGIQHVCSPTGLLTVSCGCVTVGSCDGASPRLLLKEADELLYKAKLAGRNQSVIGTVQPDPAPAMAEAAQQLRLVGAAPDPR